MTANTIIPIEISDSSMNGTSLLLAAVILVSFIILTVFITRNLYDKLHPYTQYGPSFKNALTQNTMQNIKNIITNVTNDAEIKQISKYNDQLTEWTKTIYEYENMNVSIANILNTKFENIQDYFSSRLTELSGNLVYYTNAVGQLNSIADDNIQKFETAYYTYQEKLQSYVQGVVSMIGTVIDQITNATVIPSLYSLIGPLKNVYQAMYSTLNDNLSFIKDIYPEFSMDLVPTLPNTPIQSNLASSFKSSTAILTSAGYK